MASDRIEQALAVLRAQYLETPSLLLTPGEAAELVDLDRTTTVALLQALEQAGFLVLTADGRFGRSADRLRAATMTSSRHQRRAG